MDEFASPRVSPPLCKDCRFVRRDTLFGWQFATCWREQRTSPVTGETEFKRAGYACVERGDDALIDVCGPSGRYFKPREKSHWLLMWLKGSTVWQQLACAAVLVLFYLMMW